MKVALLVVIFGTLPLSVFAQPAAGSQNPFVGTRVADLSRSEPPMQILSVSLEIAVRGDAVSVTDRVFDASGQDVGFGTVTYQADAKEHPHDDLAPGMIVVARWNGSNNNLAKQVIVFDRK